MKKIFVIFAMLLLTSCSPKMTAWWNQNEGSLMLATHISTDIALRAHPADAPIVTHWVNQIQAGISAGTLVNASDIDTFIRKQMAGLNLTPADQIVMNDLLGKLENGIKQEFIDKKITDPSLQVVEINKVLGWVKDISTSYVQ